MAVKSLEVCRAQTSSLFYSDRPERANRFMQRRVLEKYIKNGDFGSFPAPIANAVKFLGVWPLFLVTWSMKNWLHAGHKVYFLALLAFGNEEGPSESVAQSFSKLSLSILNHWRYPVGMVSFGFEYPVVWFLGGKDSK